MQVIQLSESSRCNFKEIMLPSCFGNQMLGTLRSETTVIEIHEVQIRIYFSTLKKTRTIFSQNML